MTQPGVRVRLAFKFILLFGVPMIIVGGLINSILASDMFNVVAVEINDESWKVPVYLTKQAAVLDSDLQRLIGKRIWRVSVEEVSAQLASLPWVAKVAATREFPNKIKVTYSPKVPKAGFIQNSRKIVLVASDGSLFPPTPFNDAPEVIILRGHELRTNAERRRRALEIYSEIPEDGNLQKSKVAELAYLDGTGYTLTLLGGQTQVHLGEEDIPLRLARVEKVLTYLQSKSIVARVIDANYLKKVLVRPRKGS